MCSTEDTLKKHICINLDFLNQDVGKKKLHTQQVKLEFRGKKNFNMSL